MRFRFLHHDRGTAPAYEGSPIADTNPLRTHLCNGRQRSLCFLLGKREGSGAAISSEWVENSTCEMAAISDTSWEWGEILQLTRMLLGDQAGSGCNRSPREAGSLRIPKISRDRVTSAGV